MYSSYRIVLAVGAFILDKKGRLLLVKKTEKERIDAGLWTVPGGKINLLENIIDGLRREIKEEVSLNLKAYDWVGEDVFTRHGYVFHAQHFLCSVEEPSTIHLEKTLTEYKWIDSLKSIEPQKMPDGIRNRIISIPLL